MGYLSPEVMLDKKRKLSFKFIFLLVLICVLAISVRMIVFYFSNQQAEQAESPSVTEVVVIKAIEWPYLKVGFETADDLKFWTRHSFHGEAKALIQADLSGEMVLTIESNNDAELFLKEANVPIERAPKLSWEWKVSQFPSGKKHLEFGAKEESDFAARVYVVFKGMTNFTSPTIQYIWDDHFSEGTNREIPFFKHLKLMVVRRTSHDEAKEWHKETRDIIKDYELLFGEPPTKAIHAIGMMSDSDNTKTRSEAQYRNLRLEFPDEAFGSRVVVPSSPLEDKEKPRVSPKNLSFMDRGHEAVTKLAESGRKMIDETTQAIRNQAKNKIPIFSRILSDE
jgi:hypothetical protein